MGGKKESMEMERVGKSNKENKEFVSFQLLQIESLLWEVVNKSNELVDGDGCSIFLREEGTTRYILRDSTVMNPYLGNYYFEVTPEEEKKEKMGATKFVVVSKGAQCVPDLRDLDYWSYHGLLDKELESEPIRHCEISHHRVGSFLAVPLKEKGEVVGVIRVVRNRDREPFNDEDKTRLEELIEKYLPKILGASTVSHLLEIGLMLDLKALCGQIVQVLTGMLRCRGCSIYLYEEEDGKYRCMGTTGLHEALPDGSFQEIKDPYKEAYYEYNKEETPKHLTTAVIKYGLNIITDDQAEFDPEKVFPEIERERAKYWETWWKDGRLVPAGPSIFVPLWEKEDKSNVIGVIVINRPQGEEEFSQPEFRLCLSLSERLSKIILYSRFMSLLNKPLTIEDPADTAKLEKSFDPLIDQICVVSGAPGATLFFKFENKLKSRSSSGRLRGEEIIYVLPPSPSDYGSPPFKGYTVWVATFKEVLKFNSPDELDQWSGAFRPRHSGKGECEVANTPPDRFMGVPIMGTNDELIGVLRTPKTKGDAPFTANDEMLFSSLANRLSPVIENLISLERFKKKKIFELEEIFTKELKDKIGEVTGENETINFIAKRVRDFFTIDPRSEEEDSGTRVLKSIGSLWVDSKILLTTKGKDKEGAPLESFKFFDEQMLTELPGYRGHFIHQYQVFLLGYYIIEMLKKLGSPFHNSYYQSLIPHSSATEEEKEEVANIAWLVTSTFHDIAYPLEEIKRWLPKMISNFLGEAGKEIIPVVPIERIFFQADQTYLKFVNELARFFNENNFIRGIKESDFRDWLQMEVANKDHGVLSSLILLTLRLLRKEEVILPAALAMALHKKLGLKVKTHGGKINYAEYPLFFLLLYCDIVQEWYRDPKDVGIPEQPTLKKIVVTKDVKEIGEVMSKIPQKVIENNETIYIHSEIVLASGAGNKIKEVEDWFGFIHSQNPYFSIKINAEFIGSWEPDGHEP